MKTVFIINYLKESEEIFYEIQLEKGIRAFNVYLREEIERSGYRFQITEDCKEIKDLAALLCLQTLSLDSALLPAIRRLPKQRCLLFTCEPPHLNSACQLYHPAMKEVFGTIFTTLDDCVDQVSYFKIYHPQVRDQWEGSPLPWSERRLCVMVQRCHNDSSSCSPAYSLYDKRIEAVKSFARYPGALELYGMGWHGYPGWIRALNADGTKEYMLAKKFIFHQYRFCLAYENMHRQRGYITERIFDALYCGIVPIYWGADNIADYVDERCYVDRRSFSSNEALYEFMVGMKEVEHQRYLKAAQAYLATPQAALFHGRAVARSVVERIRAIHA